MNTNFSKFLLLFISFIIAFSCSKDAKKTTDKDVKTDDKKQVSLDKKEELKDVSIESLNGKLDKEDVVLANPDGTYFEQVKEKWKIKDFNFSVYEMAYDEKKGVLVGMNKEKTLVKAVNVNTGKVLWKRKIDLKKAEKLEERKSEEDETEYISLQEGEASRDNSEPSFTFDGDKTVIIAVNKRNNSKKWLYDLKYYGLDIKTGKLKWSKTLVKGDKKMPYPSTWLQYGWALWTQKSAVYLGEPEKGPLYILDPRNGEWYDIQYPLDTSIKYSFAGTDAHSAYFFKYGTGSEFTIKAVDKLDGSTDTKYAWEQKFDCRLRSAFFLGKEIDNHIFLCSKKPEEKGAYKHIDSIVKFDEETGKKIWETILDERTPSPNITRDMIYTLDSKDKKKIYIRSLFYLAKIDAKDGKLLWKTTLNPSKVNGIFVDDQFFNHQWVLGGDEAYDDYFMLNPNDGSKLWSASVVKTEKNKNPGMPANASIEGDWVLSYGDNIIKILDKKTGKIVWKHRTQDKIESLYLTNGIFYLETQGVRIGYKIPSFELWSYSRTKSETLLNNGWMKNLGSQLLLHNEDDFILYRLNPLEKSMKRTLPASKLVKGKVLTTQSRFSSLKFSKDGKSIYFSTNDKDATRTSKINVDSKKIEKLDAFEEYGYSIITKSKVKELIVKDGKKVRKKVEQYYLKSKDGKETLISDNELEYYKFSKDNKKIFLVTADNQYFDDEVDFKDLIFKVYDIENNKFHEFFILRNAIAVVRGKIKETIVRYGDFMGDDKVSFTIENMHAHKGVYTMKYEVKTPLEIKIETSVDDDEIVNFNFKENLNLNPTSGLEFQETDFNHSFYDSLGTSSVEDFALGENFGLKYGSSKSKDLTVFDNLITTYDWAPKGKYLAMNSGGNIYILNTENNKLDQVTWFLPKREPKNFDDTKVGNKFRILSVAFSPNGETLAIVIKMPDETLRRIVLVDVKEYIK
jgi:hypothetical protein